MIYNGIDLVKITRFSTLIEKESFKSSIFTEQELTYIEKHNNNISTMAGIFAAKEAFLKALKKGINNYSLKEIEISHDENNAPFLILHGQIKKDFPMENLSLSISHDGDYAVAVVSILSSNSL